MASSMIKIKYVSFEAQITNRAISQAWGGIYQTVGVITIDISSLGLSKAPKVLGACFRATGGYVAWVVLDGVSKDSITCYLCRGVSGTVTGVIDFMLEIQ